MLLNHNRKETLRSAISESFVKTPKRVTLSLTDICWETRQIYTTLTQAGRSDKFYLSDIRAGDGLPRGNWCSASTLHNKEGAGSTASNSITSHHFSFDLDEGPALRASGYELSRVYAFACVTAFYYLMSQVRDFEVVFVKGYTPASRSIVGQRFSIASMHCVLIP